MCVCVCSSASVCVCVSERVRGCFFLASAGFHLTHSHNHNCRLLHRLDQNTTGVLLIGRHREATSVLSKLFERVRFRAFGPHTQQQQQQQHTHTPSWPAGCLLRMWSLQRVVQKAYIGVVVGDNLTSAVNLPDSGTWKSTHPDRGQAMHRERGGNEGGRRSVRLCIYFSLSRIPMTMHAETSIFFAQQHTNAHVCCLFH